MAGLEGLRQVEVEVPLVAGLDQRDDPKFLELGKLTTMRNLELNRIGRLEQRRGVDYVAGLPPAPSSGGTTDTVMTGIVSRDTEPVLVGQRRVNVYDTAAASYRYRGRAPGPAVTSEVVQATPFLSLVMQDSNTLNDMTVVASVEMPGDPQAAVGAIPWMLHVDVIGATSKQRLYSWAYDLGLTSPTSALVRTMVITQGHFVFVVAAWTSTINADTIYFSAIPIDTTATYTTKPTIYPYNSGSGFAPYAGVSTAAGTPSREVVIDGCGDGSMTDIVVAFPTSETQIQFVYINTDGTYAVPTPISGNARWGLALAKATVPGALYDKMLVFSDGTQVKAAPMVGVAAGSGSWQIAPTARVNRIGVVATGVTSVYGEEYVAVYESTTSTLAVHTLSRVFFTTGGSAYSTHATGVDFCTLMSRPFMQDGQAYVVASDGRGVSYFLLDLNYVPKLSSGGTWSPLLDTNIVEVVSVITPQLGGGTWSASLSAATFNSTVRHLSSPNVANGAWQVALPRSVQPRWNWAAAASGTPLFRNPTLQDALVTNMTTFTFAAPARHLDVDHVARLTGGMVTECDFGRAYEVDFCWEPWAIQATAAAGGAMEAGTYLYTGCYAYYRPDGTVERSAPAAPASVVIDGSTHASAVVQFVPITLTNKTSASMPERSVVFELYRTCVIGGAMSSEFYLVGSQLMAQSSGYVDYAQMTDGLASAHAQYNPAIYSNPSISTIQATNPAATTGIPHFQPPSATSACEHRGRIFLAGCEDPTMVYPSLYLQPLKAAAWSPEAVALRYPEPIVAVASMDDGLYAFSETGIWYVAGDGPDDNGQNDNWTQPVRIQSDVGCVDPRSVVTVPAGVMFQSNRGIYLLDRSRQVSYVGAAVEADVTGNTTVTSAVLCQDRRHARFGTTWGRTGQTASYFYEYDQWGDSRYAAYGGGSLASTAACTVGTTYWMTGADGYLYRESTGYAEADGTVATYDLVTGWLSIVGKLRWERVRFAQLLMELAAPCTVVLTAYSDYDMTGNAGQVTKTGFSSRLVGLRVTKQKGNAVRLAVSVTPNAPNNVVRLNALAFQGGMRSSGLKRLPAAQRG